MTKFKAGDIVLYVNPFVFTIEVVNLEILYEDDLGTYWIDSDGAYLQEQDLHKTLESAKNDALNKLQRFYNQKLHEIKTQQPLMNEE